MKYILELKNICKSFGEIVANKNLNLQIKPGVVHAILGKNGAGKSTLIHLLNGLYQPDSGEILINGAVTTISSPKVAKHLGVGTVYQHFMLFRTLSVMENLILSDPNFDGNNVMLNMSKYGIEIDLEKLVSDLTVAEQQQVEILRALIADPEIIIFDEPTAVLSIKEIEQLYRVFEILKQEGKTVVFVTHTTEEIMQVADRVSVIKLGEVIAELDIAKITEEDLRVVAFERDPSLTQVSSTIEPGKEIFSLSNLNLTGDQNISLKLRAGEIMGIVGLSEKDKKALFNILSGLDMPVHGKVFFHGEDITGIVPSDLRVSDIRHIPEDRIREGSISQFSLAYNLILGKHRSLYSKALKINFARMLKDGVDILQKYSISPRNLDLDFDKFSGGNQQKAIIAREVESDYQILILFNPTRGIDLESVYFIYERLIEQKMHGRSIILITSEIPEAMILSDKISVLRKGEIIKTIEKDHFDKEKINFLMSEGESNV